MIRVFFLCLTLCSTASAADWQAAKKAMLSGHAVVTTGTTAMLFDEPREGFVAIQAADVTVPAETRGQPGRILTIAAETEGKRVEWYVLDAGLDLLPISEKSAVVAAPVAGRYRVLCWSALGDQPTKAVICTVVIGDEVNPPKPPVPPPDTGSFESRVKAAYGNDRSPTKAESLKKLIALYEVAQGAVPRASTLADLREDLKVASDALVPPGSLTEVRRLIGAELLKVLGDDPAIKIDEPLKARAVQLFQRIASVLQGVTG